MPIYKLHGTRRRWVGGSKPELVQAAADRPYVTARRIAQSSPRRRLNEIAMRWLHRVVDDRDLVVVGYSGSDDLDIVPALALTAPRRIIWIEYARHAAQDRTAPWLAPDADLEKQRLLQRLADRGTDVRVLEGEPHQILSDLGIPPVVTADEPAAPNWKMLLRPWLDVAVTREPTGLALAGFLLSETMLLDDAQACFVDAHARPGIEARDGWTRARREYELAQQETFRRAGDQERALVHIREAVRLAQTDGDGPLEKRAQHLLARLLFYVDRDHEAADVLDAALEGSEGATRASLLEWRGHVAFYLAGPNDAFSYLDEAAAEAERAGDFGVLADTLNFRADLHLRQAHIAQALDDVRASAEVSMLPQPDRLFSSRVLEAECLFAVDKRDEAERVLHHALQSYEDRADDNVEVFDAHRCLARIAAERGDYERARSTIAAGLALDSAHRREKSTGPLMAEHIAFELLAGNPGAALAARRRGTFTTQHASAVAYIFGFIAGKPEDELAWALEARVLRDHAPNLAYYGSVVARVSHNQNLLAPFMRSAEQAARSLQHHRWTSLITTWLA